MKHIKTISILFTLVASGYWLLPHSVYAASNIDATNRWAWNDIVGWIDFQFLQNPNVQVTDTALQGYASSSVGFISLNCASGPPGSNCTNNYSVVNTQGTLSGWAWNDVVGWISFNCSNTGTCGNAQYSVTIIGNDFSGWAWNDVVGWISFNCSNTGTCGTVSYKITTTWTSPPQTGTLTGSIFDTGATNGANFEELSWQGALNGGEVKFQIASSVSSGGPWNFVGPDGSSATYYGGGSIGPNTQLSLGSLHISKRYIRYKAFLTTNVSLSPQIDAVIITYTK